MVKITVKIDKDLYEKYKDKLIKIRKKKKKADPNLHKRRDRRNSSLRLSSTPIEEDIIIL